MRNVSKIVLIVSLWAGFVSAQTTSTITGTVRDLTQALVTSGKVTFQLTPSRDTTISGYARFSSQTVTCTINASGLIKALDGTSVCTITMNTALQPTGTYYAVCYWPSNVKTACFTFYAVLSSYDWSTVVPTPTTSPAQNFVDIFSNQTIGGNKVWTGQQTFSGTNIFSGSNSFNGVTSLTGGAVVSVSGTGCGTTLALLNIDVTPVNPNRYFRLNQATGALEILNSACSAVILSIDNTGNITSSTASDLTIQGFSPTSPGNGKAVSIIGGNGNGGSASGGSATLRGGTGALGNGGIAIGDANTSSVQIGDTAGAKAVNIIGVPQIKGTPLYVYIDQDFTLAANTNLQRITGLTQDLRWTLRASTSQTVPFSCHLLYSQATAAVADQFGFQISLAPANAMLKAQVATSATAETDGNVPNLTTTTATAIVTFTPSAITTIWNADIDGLIETGNGAQANVDIMAQTSNAADLITVKRGSFCRIN